jgi:hypothetical protein
LSPQQKEQVSAGYAADARFLTAGKRIIDVRHEAFRKLTSIRTRLSQYWRGLTLPFTEPGVRLIRQSDIESFVHTLEGFRDELVQAEAELDRVFGELKNDARRRLGSLYDAADYPPRIRDLFNVEWDFPAVEPPAYLMSLNQELYEAECQRVAARFDEAVRLAEQAFTSEFAKLLSHLCERLGSAGGEQRVFRDSCVTNLTEFFARFKHLNVSSSAELDALVAEAQKLVQGVQPQQLRDDAGLRQQIASEMARMQERVEGLLVEQPRRRIVRSNSSTNGASHAIAH